MARSLCPNIYLKLMIKYFISFLELVSTQGAFKCFLDWKLFSFSAFKIVCRLKKHGVLPQSIVDVGANLGQFSIASYHNFPESLIIPVEPDKAIARRLERNLPDSISNNVICCAVGDYDGNVTFQINADPQNSSILSLDVDRRRAFPANVVLREVSVPISKLDTLLDTTTLPKPILLKIDVQGYEENVIRGSINSLKDVRWVVMEISFARLYKGEAEFLPLIDLMASHGFRFVRPLNFHLGGNLPDIIEMDALFEKTL